MDIDGLVEVKGIKTFVRLAQFIQKQVYIITCCILNFSRYFSLQSGISLIIFTVILPNISPDLDLVVSGGIGLLFPVDILSAILSILSATQVYCIIFFLD